ncbi:MAG: hypothetical protein WC564_02815 [Patescibacteria group bacterium]|jgi:hypothetical protein
MNKIKIFSGLLLLNFLMVFSASAFCPVCVVAAGAGLGFSRWLGIDDVITSLWIGGLLVAVSAWTVEWLMKKKVNFKGMSFLTYLAYYAMVIIPFYSTGFIGHPFNRLWNIDKILLGIIIGSLAFYFVGVWYQHLKRKNDNRAHFPFQKVVMPLGSLLVLSFIFYFLTK